MNKLLEKKCVPCEGGVVPFDISEIHKYQKMVDGWNIIKDKKDIYFFDFIKFGLLSINNEASCCALFEGLRLKIVIMTGESMEKVVDTFCFFSAALSGYS